MSRRRPPRSPWQRLSDGNTAQRTAGAGLLYNAAPIPAQAAAVAQALASVAGSDSGRAWQKDRFVLASGGAQGKTLTYLPIDGSLFVFLNTAFQDEGTGRDWTVSDQTLSLLSGAGALTSDILTAQYEYLVGLPAAPTDYGSDYATAVMADSPVGYWRMNDVGAALADFTNNNHDATTTTGSGYTRQQTSLLTNDPDYSTTFTNNTTRFSIPAHADFNFTTAFSCEFWTKQGASGTIGVVAYDTRWAVVINGGQLELRVNNAQAAISSAFIPANANIKYLALTWDGTTVRYYLDGVLVDSDSYGGTMSDSATALLIGSAGNDTLGFLDEVALYNYALDGTRITAHWDAR